MKTVLAHELLNAPQEYANLRICVEGLWGRGFEYNSFLGACVNTQDARPREETTSWVRIQGVWKGPGQYGHLGVMRWAIDAESIAEVRPLRFEPMRDDDLRARVQALEHRPIHLHAQLRFGFRTFRIAQLPILQGPELFGLNEAQAPMEPVGYQAEVQAVVHGRSLYIFEGALRSGPTPLQHPSFSEAELRQKISAMDGEFVRVQGRLMEGSYWPKLAGVDLVPPELSNTASAYVGSSKPEHPAVLAWRKRLRAAPEGLVVTATAVVLGGRKLLCSTLELAN